MCEFLKSLKYIVLSFVSLGVVFFTISLSSFASSVPSVPDDYNQVCFKLFKGSQSTTGYDSSKSYACKVNSAYNLLSYTWFSNTNIINVEVEVYLTTTSGTYLIGAQSTSRTGSVSLDTTVYYDGYPVSYYAIAKGYLRGSAYYVPTSSYAEGTLSIGFDIVDNPSDSIGSVKADTQTIISMLSNLNTDQIYDVLLDIWTYLNLSQRSQIANLLSTLIDADVELETIEEDLSSLMSDVSLLKRSQCYDFPLTIDGNYQLSTCYFIPSLSSFNSLNFYHYIDYFAFSFENPVSSFKFYGTVPESRVVRVLLSPYATLGNFFDFSGNVLSTSVSINNTSDFRILTYTFSSSVPVGGIYYIQPTLSSSGSSFAVYNYVISANDILDYMKSQWASTQPSTDSLDVNISDTGDMQGDVNLIEDTAFTDFTGAYEHTGIAAFSWTVFTGMTLFSSIVNKFYFALPSEFSLYITAVLIVGVIAVLISAVGRIIKKGGD